MRRYQKLFMLIVAHEPSLGSPGAAEAIHQLGHPCTALEVDFRPTVLQNEVIHEVFINTAILHIFHSLIHKLIFKSTFYWGKCFILSLLCRNVPVWNLSGPPPVEQGEHLECLLWQHVPFMTIGSLSAQKIVRGVFDPSAEAETISLSVSIEGTLLLT